MNFLFVILLFTAIVGAFSSSNQNYGDFCPICAPPNDPAIPCTLPLDPVKREIWETFKRRFLKRYPTCTRKLKRRGKWCREIEMPDPDACPQPEEMWSESRKPVRESDSEKKNFYCDDPENERSGTGLCIERGEMVTIDGREEEILRLDMNKLPACGPDSTRRDLCVRPPYFMQEPPTPTGKSNNDYGGIREQPVRAIPNPPESSNKFIPGETILFCDDPKYKNSGRPYCLLRK